MSEAAEQKAPETLTLEEIHVAEGADLKEYAGWILPATYGDVLAEYAAVRNEGAGLLDLSARGRVRVNGSEAVQFLNGMITNDLKTLAEGHWMPAAFPSVQGRLIAMSRIAHDRGGFLIDTESTTRERVLQVLNRFTLAGDFHVLDLHSETSLLSLQGKAAETILRAVLKENHPSLEKFRLRRARWQDAEIIVLRANHTAENGFDLFVANKHAAALWKALTLEGARPVGREALEILRIEAGLPLYGVDMDETKIVTEANLDDAVNYTKGCYIGQEIIARIHWRGHVAKKMTGITSDATNNVSKDSRIRSTTGQEIGKVTSSVYSPILGKTIVMAYLKYDYLKPGTDVIIATEDQEIPGRVTELPFVRGSWDEAGQE